MTVRNSHSGTTVHEVFDRIYRIDTMIAFENGNGFSFTRCFIEDDEPF